MIESRSPSEERADLLFGPILESSVPARLGAVAEELRVARLVAHLRPYLLSSTVAATHPVEQRLDELLADRRAREARRRALHP